MPKGTTPLEEAAIQDRLWTPALLSPAVWFDFSAGLFDQSANRRAVTVVGSPPLSSVLYNGRPGRVFTKDNAYLRTTLNMMNKEWSAVYAFVRVAANHEYVVFGSGGFGSATNDALWSGIRNAGNTIMFSQWLNDFDPTNVPPFEAHKPTIVTGSRRRTGSFVKTNGGSLQTKSEGTLPTGGSSETQIGSAQLSNSSAPFTICEILLFTTGISDQEMALLEGYLGHKWGVRLAGDNPFVNRPPVIGD
jgi:hypothetical protein